MRVQSVPAVLEAHASRAATGAAGDVLDAARGSAPRDSGRYAASLEMTVHETPSGTVIRIGSRLPYAGAVERGANVGPRRGPHMGPVGRLREAGSRFGDAFVRHARAMPIGRP